jgi:hypothetical protein
MAGRRGGLASSRNPHENAAANAQNALTNALALVEQDPQPCTQINAPTLRVS